MAKIAMDMLSDIDKETVDFQPNFDDRHKEPVVLPARFPNLLANGSTRHCRRHGDLDPVP